MAKKAARTSAKNDVNKSQAIRDHMAKFPDDGPNAVAAALKKSGVDVSPAFVSTVKSMDKRRAQHLPHLNGDQFSKAALLQAKKLVAETGDIERAKAALEFLTQLVN